MYRCTTEPTSKLQNETTKKNKLTEEKKKHYDKKVKLVTIVGAKCAAAMLCP